MKGIGYSYRIYTLATRPQLNSVWHRGHDQRDLLLAPTLERFPLELRDRLFSARLECIREPGPLERHRRGRLQHSKKIAPTRRPGLQQVIGQLVSRSV
jgi:hypothetical protein